MTVFRTNTQDFDITAETFGRAKLSALSELARPAHAVKNLLVLAPLALTGQGGGLMPALLACLAFTLAAMAVYAINDAFDAFYDTFHPSKCARPIPSGRISEREAFVFAGLCIVLALAIGVLAVPAVLFFVPLYVVLNVFYSHIGKDIAIVDITIVSSGFVLRFLLGAAAIGQSQEIGILAGPLFLAAMGLAIGKRFAKVVGSTDRSKVRLPAFYNESRLTGMTLVASHFAAGLCAALLVLYGAGLSEGARISALAAVAVGVLGIAVLSRVVYLMLFRSIEPAEVFTRDRLTMAAAGVLGMILVFDAVA